MFEKRRLWTVPSILWHEGMLLAPHHFQQNDKRIECALAHHHYAANPYAWGVHRMTIDTLSIGTGFFSILDLDAIMPDGTIVSYTKHTHQAKPLDVDLRPFKEACQKTTDEITLFLSMPTCLIGSHGHTEDDSTEQRRFYSIEGGSVSDDHARGNVITMHRLLPNLHLTVSDHVPAYHTGFPLVKIAYQDTFTVTAFTPPCLFVSHDMHIWQKCKSLVIKMREKGQHLCGTRQNQMGTSMVGETEHLLRPLMMALPKMESILNTPHVSPYTLYQTLLETIALLSPLQMNKLPPVMPGYVHDDILNCMTPALSCLDAYLDTIEQSYSIFPFQQKDRLFYLYLNGNQMQSTLYVGVRIGKGMSEDMLEDWMMDAIIASDFAVDSVRSRRMTGARRSRIDHETQFEMMPARGVVIFEIPFDPEFMAINQNLNIFNPHDHDDRRPMELVLHIKKAGVFHDEF